MTSLTPNPLEIVSILSSITDLRFFIQQMFSASAQVSGTILVGQWTAQEKQQLWDWSGGSFPWLLARGLVGMRESIGVWAVDWLVYITKRCSQENCLFSRNWLALAPPSMGGTPGSAGSQVYQINRIQVECWLGLLPLSSHPATFFQTGKSSF